MSRFSGKKRAEDAARRESQLNLVEERLVECDAGLGDVKRELRTLREMLSKIHSSEGGGYIDPQTGAAPKKRDSTKGFAILKKTGDDGSFTSRNSQTSTQELLDASIRA